MKRILHVVSSMNAGGMETMIMNYYRHLDRTKYQFDFMIHDPNPVFFEKEIASLGGKIYRVSPQRPNPFKNHKEIRALLKTHHFDAIHVHQGITYFYPLKYAKKIGIPNRIVHNHGINRQFLKYLKLYNNLYARKRISSLGNHFIACSETVLNHLFSNQIIQKKQYIILPNAIDVEKFCYDEQKRDSIRKEFHIGEEKVFLHIGTFTKPKNHVFMLEAFNSYVKKDPQAKLLLVGEGILKSEVEHFVQDSHLQNNVIFTGVRQDVPALLSAADAMLFPSLYEGLPLTLIEAQSSGIPILASDQVSKECGLTDLISFLPIHDSNIWVTEMERIPKNTQRKLYQDKMLNTDFSIKKSIRILEKLYDLNEEEIK